ncbi:uncharacterized protein MYU51_002079 [Penicillium brevicompactum]|uniref:uncharacterized protein n=1 Tax=Penicillium brevicompactum TaxID=5074 RepID=UPI00253FED02|nr:uncharacterized protein N7506_003784 [Penicillium brevicompactum]KAJ5343960.1 hypothetical protein N7506_003784 [Penicillium brevicompactum]
MGDHVLFFYGTLMAPQVLHRVIHGSPNPEPWQKAMISFQPAILHGYRRHRVQHADYPGILPVDQGTGEQSASDATSARKSVLGTLVSGLTDQDVRRLDCFEGADYTRKQVVVHKLQKFNEVSGDACAESLPKMLDAARTAVADEEETPAMTYVWTSGKDWLEDAEWDFEAFKKDKLAWWAGTIEDEF